MSKIFNLWVTPVLVIMAAAAVLLAYGCQSEDPAAEMAKSISGSAPPASTSSAPPADSSSGVAAIPQSSASGDSAAAGGAKPAAGGEAEPDAGAKPADGAAGEKVAESGAKPDAAKDKTPAEPGKDTAKGKDKAKSGGEGGIADDERITDFSKLDPREIILKKYESMAAKHTRPWDPEKDLEDFLPETGRVDPLNPVNSAIPDELKPPRSGETNQNDIQTYLIAVACTAAVDAVRSMLQVRNVLKIGAVKYVTIAMGEGPDAQGGTVEVGSSFQFYGGMVNFVPIFVTLTVDSATEDEVVITVTAEGYQTSTSVSKSTTFIPVGFAT